MPDTDVPPPVGVDSGADRATTDGASTGGATTGGVTDVPAWRAWPPGTRVVVRRVRDDVPVDEGAPAGGEPRYTDVLGDVLAVDDAGVVVRTRHGDVAVPAATIRLTKVVPPAPERRRPRPS